MIVAGLSKDQDWQFGRGKATYLVNRAAVRQNVVTRLRSWKDDWFLDVEAGLDWLTLLGTRGNRDNLTRAIEREVTTTEGVRSVTRLDVTLSGRDARISLVFLTIFDDQPESVEL